jgi:hypothetical protein
LTLDIQAKLSINTAINFGTTKVGILLSMTVCIGPQAHDSGVCFQVVAKQTLILEQFGPYETVITLKSGHDYLNLIHL